MEARGGEGLAGDGQGRAGRASEEQGTWVTTELTAKMRGDQDDARLSHLDFNQLTEKSP